MGACREVPACAWRTAEVEEQVPDLITRVAEQKFHADSTGEEPGIVTAAARVAAEARVKSLAEELHMGAAKMKKRERGTEHLKGSTSQPRQDRALTGKEWSLDTWNVSIRIDITLNFQVT